MATIRAVRPDDTETWLDLRCALWPEGSRDEHREEIGEFFKGIQDAQAVLLAEETDGRIVGMAELSIRSYAEGCTTNRVAYLEGWYVVPEFRGKKIGRQLVEAAEDWGRVHGCCEFASDSYPDNKGSIAAHLALGFDDIGLIRCFKKDL